MIRLRLNRWSFAVALGTIALAGCLGPHAIAPLPSRADDASFDPQSAEHGYKVLYNFRGGADGAKPQAPLLPLDGKLYGTTPSGGRCSFDATGCGTVFVVNASGDERVLHQFAAYPDGALPYGGLIATKGELYGTTSLGGARSDASSGAIYAITPSGSERIVYSFAPDHDGKFPSGELLAVNGKFYGTTRQGGASRGPCYSVSCGTIFDLTPAGKERVLYSFSGGFPSKDAQSPHGGLTLANGVFYGTTYFGGKFGEGTVFRVTASGKEQVLHNFSLQADGGYPSGPLVFLHGELYGTVGAGGANGGGGVFAIGTNGKERSLHIFKGGSSDGSGPIGGLVFLNGSFYGTTVSGGTGKCFSNDSSCGTIFKIMPSGKESVLYKFKGGRDGAAPFSGLTVLNDVLYGTTSGGGAGRCSPSSGGTAGCGTVFRILP